MIPYEKMDELLTRDAKFPSLFIKFLEDCRGEHQKIDLEGLSMSEKIEKVLKIRLGQ